MPASYIYILLISTCILCHHFLADADRTTLSSSNRIAPKPRISVSGSTHIRIGRVTERLEKTNKFLHHKFNQYYRLSRRLNKLRIIVIGDQGGDAGKPSAEYLSAINEIAAIHASTPIHAILTIGDNVYPNGINSSSHHLLDAVFRDPFRGKGLRDVPFFAVMGNHDHCLEPFEQINYSMKQIDTHYRYNHPAFLMPDWFYNVQFVFGAHDTKIDFAFIDSMVNRGRFDTYAYCKKLNKTQKRTTLERRSSTWFRNLKTEMRHWLRRNLRKRAEEGSAYQVLVMHHAIHSTMKHGGCNKAKELEKEILTVPATDGSDRFAMNLVLSGHDHAMEYGEVESTGLRQAIIGGTRHCDGLTWKAKVRDKAAALLKGRWKSKLQQFWRSRYKREYAEHKQSVKNRETGWKGCEYGGFAELVFTENVNGGVDAKIKFYSGTGRVLYSKDI